ncbi:MAG: hypothetical protein Q4B85_12680 [Lachnospiraceae bacterium]|nr:hypothetical protein [Lachnospiraceae bacterium]
MTNLIRSAFSRLFKARVFWNATLFCAGLGLFEIMTTYLDCKNGYADTYIDCGLFAIAPIALFPLAALVTLFVGCEFSDGAIRNKIVVGRKRCHIYLANLLVSVAAGWGLILVWSLCYLIPGLLLMEMESSLTQILTLYGMLLCEMAVFAALYNFLTMLLGNKATAAVVCILLTIVMLFHGLVVNNRLEEPEYYSMGYVVREDGSVEYDGEMIPNPNYLPKGSPARKRNEILRDFTPGGVIVQIADLREEHAVKSCLYGAGWFVALTGAGILLFRRKDLK